MATNSYKIELATPRRAVTEAALKRFEETTGRTIPREYRQFLVCQNGGSPVNNCFSYGKGPYRDSVVRDFLGIEAPGEFDLARHLRIYEDRIPGDMFPIATDFSDNVIVISQRRGTTNHVYFWDHEKEEADDQSEKEPIFVSKSLTTFLKTLIAEEVECDTEPFEVVDITYDKYTVRDRPQRVQLKRSGTHKIVGIKELRVGDSVFYDGKDRVIKKIEFLTIVPK